MSSIFSTNIIIDNSNDTTSATSSITLDKTSSSIILGSNLNTTPQYITISPNSISDGSNSTPLSNISQLSTALSSIELPPNSTTLKIDKTLLLTDNTNSATFDINNTSGNIDLTTSGVLNLNKLPTCNIIPTTNDQLVNKLYVDSSISTNASTINITDTNTNSLFYPTFVDSSGNTKILRADTSATPLSYNPSTHSLTASTFNGVATNAINSTNTTNVNITSTNLNSTFYPTFVNGTSGNLPEFVDLGLTYNASDNRLIVPNITSNLTGIATTSNNIFVSDDNTNATYYPTFVSGSTSGSKPLLMDATTTALTYNPSTGTMSCNNFSGLASSSTNSSNISCVSDNQNTNCFIPYVATSGTGFKQLLIDDTVGPFTYNPSTQTLVLNAINTNPTSASLVINSKAIIRYISPFGVVFGNSSWATGANYAFYAGDNGENNFNAVAQSVSGSDVTRLNFGVGDVKYMTVAGSNARLGNIGIRTLLPDYALDVRAGGLGGGAIRAETQVISPQIGNILGNLNLVVNQTGTGGTLSITGGTGILSNTSSGSSGQHLVITINGTQYKLALLNV